MTSETKIPKDETTINRSTEQALEETILSPRFYTTDFDEMDKINIESLRPEWNKLMKEYEADSNIDHFQRPKEMSEDYSKLPEGLYKGISMTWYLANKNLPVIKDMNADLTPASVNEYNVFKLGKDYPQLIKTIKDFAQFVR